MPQLVANQAPPQGYYARNLRLVIETVCAQYDDLLSEKERSFAQSTLNLSTDALRLFARLLSRTRDLIRLDSLNYADVGDLAGALRELQATELIDVNSRHIDMPALLNLLTIPELRELFAECHLQGRKEELIFAVGDTLSASVIYERVKERCPWLVIAVSPEFELFCLLFFGNSAQRLDEFVIRDLGVTKYEAYSLDPTYRLFRERYMVDRYLELNAIAEFVEIEGKQISIDHAKAVYELLENREDDRVLESRRASILNALGRNLERCNQLQLALACYAASTTHPARERTMRIWHKHQQLEKVETLRTQILENPQCHDELHFARRFKRAKHVPVELPERTSAVPEAMEQPIESYAAEQLINDGHEAWHIENLLPMGLFALAYWDWFYAPVRGAFVNPFQSVPLDLYSKEFFDLRRTQCEDPLAQPKELKARILETARQKTGLSCHLIAWQVFSPEFLRKLMTTLTTSQLCSILRIVQEDLRQFRAGFPDLTVIDSQGNVSFVEVKGPGDQLRPNQRLWIERLMAAAIPVHVWRFK
ncbi:MAG: VRR-NUC domain-containing protein [Gammaproteobacteria bacterium]|nr:VRR-NUC domain-containing protein [Gammaproteobacteria bacterium]